MTQTHLSFGQVEVIRSTAEEMPIMANLLELYAHDFSEFHRIEPGPDGRFGYPDLPLYWSEPGRFPFLIKVGGKIAGFALVKRITQNPEDDETWDMAEFFVLRGYRRHGVGLQAAHSLWRLFPGRWQVRVMRVNQAALRFWSSAIAEFAGDTMSLAQEERAGELWDVFWFASARH